MEDPMVIDTVAEMGPQKQLKRKRQSLSLDLLNNKEALKLEYQQEIEGLFGFYKEVSGWSASFDNPANVNSLIAGLLEERAVSYSTLAGEIYEKVKEREGMSLASVKGLLLLLGQRVMYGISKEDADVLEDESDSCLWCWETRDLKLFPPSVRGVLSTRRIARKKIHERLSALTAIMAALEKSENIDGQVRALSNLNKVLNLVGICSLAEKLKEKNNSEMATKEARLKEKELIKEMEKDKRNADKEKKKMDRQIQIEKIKSEKEQKRMQEEVEKEAKRREKEEAEQKKQLKKRQEEAEKEQKRREKEEAEMKKQILLKKQASMMERFLSKSKKSNKEIEHSENGLVKGDGDECIQKPDVVIGAVTLSMDSAFSKGEDLSVDKIWRSHVTGWKKLMSNTKLIRWGYRQKPKTNVVKELKLLGNEVSDCMVYTKTDTINQGSEQNYDKIMDEMEVSISDEVAGQSQVPTICIVKKKLLQFDKSHRPAYYGTWRKKSLAIRPRRPLKMDPDLDYEVDSDEEWEEEDPGESLSDCEKDKAEDELEEEIPKTEEEEESEGSFVVPDGYLSEDEGIESRSQSTEEESADSNAKPNIQTEELMAFFKQQKVLHNLTEQALKKSQPLIISNLNHEKLNLLNQEGLTGMDKLQQICMQSLCMRVWPGGAAIDLPVTNSAAFEDGVVSELDGKSVGTTPPSGVTAVSDSDLPEFVRLIQSCPHGINKVVDLLQQTFTTISKTQLRNKVREVSKFVDNHWEVKKDVLDALGLPAFSPDKGGKTKGIALYFSKRCLPPKENQVNISETSPLSCAKSKAFHDQSDGQQSEPQSQPSI